MAYPPTGMEIITVLPTHYDDIVQRSQGTQNPYTREELEHIRARAQANNSVALVMFLDADFWNGPRE